MDFCGQTPWFWLAFVCFTVNTRDRFALFRGAASFFVIQHFLLTGTSIKSCLGATSVLNDFFKNGVKISLTIGCRYKTMCEYKVILPVKKWNLFSNFIAVVENAA